MVRNVFLLILTLFFAFSSIKGQTEDKKELLDSVIVSADRYRIDYKAPQMGVISVPITSVKQAPATMGEKDIFKILQLMPGVTSSGDGDAGLLIRGGAYDQTMILMDGATIYQPQHLRGYLSAINIDCIDGFRLYTGGFPSKFGGRLSGVLDITTKDGDFIKYHGGINIGLMSSSAHIQGPIIKNKLSFFITARQSYYGLTSKLFVDYLYNSPNQNNPFDHISFYDISSKITYKASNKDILSATFFTGRDKYSVEEKEDKSYYPEESTDPYYTVSKRSTLEEELWKNSVLSINYKHIGKNHNLSANISGVKYYNNTQKDNYKDYYKYKKTGNELKESSLSKIGNNIHSSIDELAANIYANFLNSSLKGFYFGADAKMSRFNPYINYYAINKIDGSTEGNNYNTYTKATNELKQLSTFIGYETSFSSIFKINGGIRATYYTIEDNNYFIPEPRVQFVANITEALSVKGAFTSMSQAINKITSTSITNQFNLWTSMPNGISPSKANQYSLGAYYKSKSISFSIEGYYKENKDIIDIKEATNYQTFLNNISANLAVGEGRAFGVELLAQKEVGKTTGWLSYTWNKAENRFNREGMTIMNGEWFAPSFNSRNNISLSITHKFNKNLEASAVFNYYSGKYLTIVDLKIRDYSLDIYSDHWEYGYNSIPYYFFDSPSAVNNYSTKRNNYKTPDYHRLDLNVAYNQFYKKGRTGRFELSIINIYNRFNVSSVYPVYNTEHHKVTLKEVCMFPIMPSLSYQYKF